MRRRGYAPVATCLLQLGAFAFGVFLAMLTELLAMAGTVMGLRDRSA